MKILVIGASGFLGQALVRPCSRVGTRSSRAGAHARPGDYNVGTRISHSLNQVARLIAAALGRDLAIERRPSRAFDVSISILDGSRTREAFGREMRITLEQAITTTLYHMQVTDLIR